MTRDDLQRGIRQQSWREGWALDWLLDDCFRAGPDAPWEHGKGQLSWVRLLNEAPPASWVGWEISRQRGKTFSFLAWALQRMGREAALPVVYLAQTGGNAEAIVVSFLREVQESLPPEWGVRIREGVLEVQSTGSELAFFGTDNKQYRRRRGRKAKIVGLDEAAFYDDLEDVEQVYTPQLQTTGGIGLYLSSPPISPAHPFSARMRALRAARRFAHDTFWSNPRINHESVIRGEMERKGMTREQLLASTDFRREFGAEEVAEETRLAMPAWPNAAELLVGDWVRPEFFDAYEAHDPGIDGDPHGSLFGYHDPQRSWLVIENELERRSAIVTIPDWTQDVKAMETELYGVKSWDGTSLAARDWANEFGGLPEYLQRSISDKAPRQPYLRVGDNSSAVCREMSALGLATFPTDKHDKAFHVDAANHLIAQGRIRIHRRCVRLIEQLHTTTWNKARSGWERTAKDHGDLVDCLVYMARNVRWHRDCRPPTKAETFEPPKPKTTQTQRALAALKGVF